MPLDDSNDDDDDEDDDDEGSLVVDESLLIGRNPNCSSRRSARESPP